ncbi:hypothetical protein M0R45_002645 [Rubus argutus]|uniref:Uncharacterized protein n=1 Tax=Rubus argutus TaxID=59490 RepID=A0AAW1VMD1_RUBAR
MSSITHHQALTAIITIASAMYKPKQNPSRGQANLQIRSPCSLFSPRAVHEQSTTSNHGSHHCRAPLPCFLSKETKKEKNESYSKGGRNRERGCGLKHRRSEIKEKNQEEK